MSFDEEKRSCMFLRMNHNRYQMSEMANNELWEAPALGKFEWHFDTQRVGSIDIYRAPPTRPTVHRPSIHPQPRSSSNPDVIYCCLAPHEPLRLTLGLARTVGDRSYFERIDFVLNTPAINSFVCETMRDSCADVWAANDLTSLGECKAKLAALPVDEGDILYRDGNTCAPSLRPVSDPPLSPTRQDTPLSPL